MAHKSQFSCWRPNGGPHCDRKFGQHGMKLRELRQGHHVDGLSGDDLDLMDKGKHG